MMKWLIAVNSFTIYPFVEKPEEGQKQNDDQIINNERFSFFLHGRCCCESLQREPSGTDRRMPRLTPI